MSGQDLLAHMRAERPPERDPGWYTCSELAEGLGVPYQTMGCRLRVGVRNGEYERDTARVQVGSLGKVFVLPVYRLKPKG
jgi:hypothetical protein